MSKPVTYSAIEGALLGTAVGDALGLPYEGLSRRRAERMLGEPQCYRFVLAHGMVSDDTEHTCMVAQSLVAAGNDVEDFARQFAKRLRLWLAGLPAGTGLATLKATIKLWLAFPATRSGVFSAGNGPAMRSPILGAAVEERDLLRQLVRASTRVTHTDPKAEYGALAVALAARLASEQSFVESQQYADELRQLLSGEPAEEFLGLMDQAIASLATHETTPEFAVSMGLGNGVSGYVYHTVPVVIRAWLANQDNFSSAVTEVIRCGGDTDTTAAIVGGIVGSSVGKAGIPSQWLTGLWEWPRTVTWMERLADQLYVSRTSGEPTKPIRLPILGVLPRNLFFLAIVLLHGFRRLLPPY